MADVIEQLRAWSGSWPWAVQKQSVAVSTAHCERARGRFDREQKWNLFVHDRETKQVVGNAEFPNAAMAVRAKELLDEVGLKPWCDSLVNHLSGGQQQRVAVARALAMTPPLVLADEPTGNLDSQSAEAVFTLFRKVNREQGTAILFVTHNAALAERCDKIIQVVDGKLIS